MTNSEREEMALKLATLHNDLLLLQQKATDDKRANTMLAHALADSELPGRFGNVTKQHVVGASPGPIYPRLPEDAVGAIPWPEGPDVYGVPIDQMEPVGEPGEVEASLRERERENPNAALLLPALDRAAGDDAPTVSASLAVVQQIAPAAPLSNPAAIASPMASSAREAVGVAGPPASRSFRRL